MNNKPRFSLLIFVLVQVFFYLPLLMLMVFSFNKSKGMHWTGFSLRWYNELFCNSPQLWKATLNSVIVAISASTLATVIGTLGAVGLTWYGFRFKKYLRVVSFLPLILPEIVIGVSLLIFFAALHLKLSLFTIFIAHTTFNIPFVMLTVMARLEEFDYAIIEAAYDLGAREIDTLWRVIVPLSLPGIMAGFLLAVTLSLEDFVITFFVAGPGSSTLPLYVYSMIRFGVSPVINSLSVVIVGITIITAFFSRNIYRYLLHK